MGDTVPFTDNECNSSLVYLNDNVMYLWQKAEDVLQAEKFMKEGNIQLSKDNWADKMKKVILPLTKDYQVEFDKSLVREIKSGEPEVKLLLQERGDYLVFSPYSLTRVLKQRRQITKLLPCRREIRYWLFTAI